MRALAQPLGVLYALGAYAQALLALPLVAAPFVAKEFALSDRDLALLTGVMSLSAFGALALARVADRRGRRAALRLSFAGLGPALIATACAPGAILYAAAQIAAGACHGALRMVSVVAVTEVSDEHARARGQSWYGLLASFASGVPVGLAALLGDRPGGWRWCFALMGLSLLGLPWVWRLAPETPRFEAARQGGRVGEARMRDLLAPRYRRRSVGLAVVGLLRGAGIGVVGFYIFHHAVKNLGLEPWAVALVFVGGGLLGNFGNPVGAIASERWGRRPTQVVFVLVTILGGVAYYLVPTDLGLLTPVLLSIAFFGFVFGAQAFGVADRLVDTELFPTALRTSYAGLRLIVEAGATALGNFGLAAFIAWFGDLGVAIAILAPGLVLPALVIFWWATTETRGLVLDEAALEEPRP
jgi:MHS family alpha-ketoglutarate permease-like MFS transporter